jgi:hypothetical protein
MLINTFHPDPKIEEWVKELPEEVRLNTMSTRFMQDACRNSDATLAEQVVNAIKAKRWEKGVALMVHGFPQVVKFNSWVEWCKAYMDQGGLHKEPVWFFRKVTTELIGDESIEAARLLAQNMSRNELVAYCRDAPNQKGFISIAKGNVMSQGPEWASVVNLLEDLSKKGRGGDFTSEQSEGPSQSSKVSSKSKESLRRRLVTAANDEDKSDKERNDAAAGLAVLDRNGTYNAACQAAGIESKQTSRRIFVQSDMEKMAEKVIEIMGRDHARELASKIISATEAQ